MIVLVPNSFGSPVREFNPNHEPAGSSKGGQFAKAPGGSAKPLGGTLPPALAAYAEKLAAYRARMEERAYDPSKRTGSIRLPSDREMAADPELRRKVQEWDASLAFGEQITLENMPEWALRQADPTKDIETAVFVDTRTGDLLPTRIGDLLEGTEMSVVIPGDAPFSRDGHVMMVHNHPNSSPFSEMDIVMGLQRFDNNTMVLGKDGSWYHMDLSLPEDSAGRRSTLEAWDTVVSGWDTVLERARYRARTATEETLAKYGLPMPDPDAGVTPHMRFAESLMEMHGRDTYTQVLKSVLARHDLSRRFTYHLAPRDDAREADRLAASFGFYRRP